MTDRRPEAPKPIFCHCADRGAVLRKWHSLTSEAGSARGAGFTFSWDASWEAKVRKQEDHWTAEFAIPLAALQYDDESTTWGVNFWRAHPIDQEAYSWSDTGGAFGRISEFGELRGLRLAAVQARTGQVDILPFASYRALQGRADDGDAGIDLIYRPSASLIGNLTLFPDFSQLESDPTLINVNDDRELSLPERRPFFRDGAELFDLPLRLFYTRRVQEIDLGVKGTGKTGGYTWAAVNAYGRIIDRYDGDAKRRANLLNLRLNRDVGERTVVGAMAVHKHQGDRDYGLLSLNGRLGLGRDWIAAGQFAGSSTGGGPGYAYHASTNWRNQSRLSGFVELEEIGDRFRPNETGLEDEAYRRARGAIHTPALCRCSTLGLPPRAGRHHLPQRVFRGQQAQRPGGARAGVPADGTGRAAARAVRAGRGIARRRPFRLLFARPQRTTERSRTAVEDAICRGRPRIRVDKRFRRALQPGRQPPGRLQLARQPRRRRQPVQPPDDRPEGAAFLLERPQGNAAPAHDDELPVHPQGRTAAVPRARDRAHLGHDGGQLQHGFRL